MAIGLDRALLNDNGAGTDWDLAKTMFMATAVGAFERRTRFLDLTTKQVMTGRKYDEFVKTWKLEAEEHTPGAEIAGQTMEKDNLVVGLEDKEFIAYANVTDVDRFQTHYDHTQKLATQAGRALAIQMDSHIAQEVVVGARTSGSGSFPGGQTLTTPRTGPIATAYPMSLNGSKRLQDDIREILRKMKEDDVDPDQTFYTFVTQLEHDVLLQDDALLSRDYTSPEMSDKMGDKLLKVANSWIIPTNNIPRTDLSGATGPAVGGTVVYAANFTKTVAIVMGPDAVATVWAGGITPSADRIPNRHSVLLGASVMKGHKAFRFETCGEIAIA